jgi:hypothetical protein
LLQSLVHHSDSVWLREGAHHVLHSWRDEGLQSGAIEKILQAPDDIELTVEIPLAAELALQQLPQTETQS